MKITTERNETPHDVNKLIIYIGDDRYHCKESYGNLEITKISDSNSELINVTPRSGNQIDLY